MIRAEVFEILSVYGPFDKIMNTSPGPGAEVCFSDEEMKAKFDGCFTLIFVDGAYRKTKIPSLISGGASGSVNKDYFCENKRRWFNE